MRPSWASLFAASDPAALGIPQPFNVASTWEGGSRGLTQAFLNSTEVISTSEMVTRYFQWKDIEAGSEHSRRANPTDVVRLMKFIGEDAPTSALNRFSLHRFSIELGNCGLAPRSRRRVLSHARDLIRWAFHAGIYPDNFGHAIKLPRLPKAMPKGPTAEEMEAMLDGACPTAWPERDRCQSRCGRAMTARSNVSREERAAWGRLGGLAGAVCHTPEERRQFARAGGKSRAAKYTSEQLRRIHANQLRTRLTRMTPEQARESQRKAAKGRWCGLTADERSAINRRLIERRWGQVAYAKNPGGADRLYSLANTVQ
jgi:hypothetical protein